MQELSLQVQALLDVARISAALQGQFRPTDLMASVFGGAEVADTVLMVDVLSLLAEDCQIEGEVWTMRPGPRRKVLDAQKDRVTLEVTADRTPVQQALAGAGDYAPERLSGLIAEPDPALLTPIAATLDQAGPMAPAYGQLTSLRAALNGARQSRRTDEILSQGFFGREEALSALDRWIGQPQVKPPLRSWHISGLPGIGKSYLLEKVIQSAREVHNPILIRLDFDRAALDVLNPHLLFEEMSRQMADALPAQAAMLGERRFESAADRSVRRPARKSRDLPGTLLMAMAEAAGASDRTVLFVLDTLEVLRSRGETHIITLFEHLDLLFDYGMPRITVISAGRGDALAPAPMRMHDHTHLTGLEDWAAEALLEKSGVRRALWPRIVPLARGNPLLLHLAGRALSDGEIDTDELPRDATVASIGGYLYRAILSRVPQDLRGVANQGLILRAINADILLGVVAPVLGLDLSQDGARAMLDTLASHHWLVDTDADGLIRHRSDVRAAFLPLIYQDDPVTTAAIDRAAADWFAERDPLLALYHRLQLVRAGDPLPEVPEEIAAGFTAPMLDDLPGRSRDAVLQAQGLRSDFGRAGTVDEAGIRAPMTDAPASKGTVRWSGRRGRLVFDPRGPLSPPDDRAVRDLAMMLERGDIREAQYILSNGFRAPFPVNSDAGVIVLCHQWQAGRWTAARRMWRMLGFKALEKALSSPRGAAPRLLLEIAAEFDFAALVDWLRSPDAPLEARSLIASPPSFALVRGALDMAMLVAGGAYGPEAVPTAALGVVTQHMERPDPEAQGMALADAEQLRARFGLAVIADARTPSATVMPLNPYGGILAARVTEGDVMHDALSRMVPEGFATLFAPALKDTLPLATQFLPTVSDRISVIEALGLTAEWLCGVTAYHVAPDWPAIAGAAERWRRTVAGVWSYGAEPPEGWVGIMSGADEGAVALVDHLLAASDPVEQALAAFLYWVPPDDGDADRLIRRFAKRYTALVAGGLPGRKDSPRAAALFALEALDRAGLPASVAAPLAVLAAHEFQIETISTKEISHVE